MSHNFVDLMGQTFGRLTVVERAENNKQGKARWRCVCECGGTKTVVGTDLTWGKTRSCGCLQKQTVAKLGKMSSTHNETKTRLYILWGAMKERCYTPSCTAYRTYGAKGIRVCKEWLESYEAFRNWALSHGYTDNLTLDRIDFNGDYCPENCRWVTMKEQQNNKRSNRFIEYQGLSLTTAQWAEKFGMTRGCLFRRLERGLPIEKALTDPVCNNKNSEKVIQYGKSMS